MTAGHLILVGAGHAHAEVLRRFARQRVPGVELTLVSPSQWAPYSGMMPGWMAGRYRWEDCCIDFRRLAAGAGARFVQGEVLALDATTRTLVLARGDRLRADWMSLNIGSTVRAPEAQSAEQPWVVPMRPLSVLRVRIEKMLHRVVVDHGNTPLRVTALGGGAAGFETLLAFQVRLAQRGVMTECALVTRGPDILGGLSAAAARLAHATLRRRGVVLYTGFNASHLAPRALVASDNRSLSTDILLWATGGIAHAWPAESGLAVDRGGFVRVDGTLRSVSHPWLFAVGDCAAFNQQVLPKSGVFSVRMGPKLARNLRRALQGGPMQDHVPQQRHLVLLNCAHGSAIGSWGSLGWQGRSTMVWKDNIDRRFIARYRV